MKHPAEPADTPADSKTDTGAARPGRATQPGATPAGGGDPMPAAGPHADPDLTAPEKTPGAGSLPDPDNPQEGDATTG